MHKINISLPPEVLSPGKHEEINFSILEGKIIIGLMGYAKSGKDTITKTFIDNYGYKRVAFADNIKREMNKHLKEAVYNDVMQNEGPSFWKMCNINKSEDIDFFTENLELKKIIRPYIIWYGETLRVINGKFCWINRAFEEDGKNMDKIILSDVRRMAELDVFRNSNEFKKRQTHSMAESGLSISENISVNNYGTLLIEVSQFGLTDSDILTIETIQTAHEQWLIDDTLWIDSRIPDKDNARRKSVEIQVKRIVKKFGIEKPEKLKFTQTTIYQELDNNSYNS